MYYLFIHKPDDIAAYRANFERVKKSIREGKTPVYSEVRSARTNLFESVPYNATQGIFMVLAALVIARINVSDILKVAVVLVVNNVCGAISNFIFVHAKHVLRVKLCNRLGIPATEENIAVMESLEYQSVLGWRYITMADLVDRGEAIRKLCAECSNMGSFACISCKILSTIKSIPPVNRWILCEDELPERDTNVLIYYPAWQDAPVQTAHIMSDGSCWEFSDGEFYPSMKDITHWMPLPPLPEPPEKE